MTSPYRPEPVVQCPNCGEAWGKHHVERKRSGVYIGFGVDDGPEPYEAMLIECPRSFGPELLDGRVKRRPPTGLLLESLMKRKP